MESEGKRGCGGGRGVVCVVLSSCTSGDQLHVEGLETAGEAECRVELGSYAGVREGAVVWRTSGCVRGVAGGMWGTPCDGGN